MIINDLSDFHSRHTVAENSRTGKDQNALKGFAIFDLLNIIEGVRYQSKLSIGECDARFFQNAKI
jgi:hypothetical protein